MTPEKIEALIDELVAEYHYAPVPLTLERGDVRELYRASLPSWCRVAGERTQPLFTRCGTGIASGYERIVIGDYGPFVEFAPEQTAAGALRCAPGQEYRSADPHFAARVKYFWLTARDNSGCKIYDQKRTVAYADYRVGLLYVSPYEVGPKNFFALP